nr:reverse transcriptase domain-containing protein [Tanacetum cinerariifolium]
SNAEDLLPIPNECEVALEDKRECDLLISENSPVCDNSDTFSDSEINDDISVYDNDFENIEYVEASLFDPAIFSIEEENVVHREEEEVDLEEISQVQDVVLREKLFSITRLISNIESLNDKSNPNRALNSFESDNSLLDNFSPEFETFCDHSKETRSGNTTHANYSLPEYDSFCFEIEPDQERLINLVENDNSDNSSNDPLLEEADLFLSDDSIPPGIENVADNPEGDVRFLEELLIDDFILSHELSDDNNLSISRPPPEPPDVESFFDLKPDMIAEEISDKLNEDKCFDPGREINVSTKIEDDDYFPFMFVIRFFLPYFIFPDISPLFLSTESEDTMFDPGISDKIQQIMAPVTRQGPSTHPNNTNLNNMTLELVQAMIDQALLRNSTNGDGMESFFQISGCAVENLVEFATCTLLDAALTWWNSQIRSLGPNAYSMTWEVLKEKMTDKYCPQGKIKKLEIELWNLKVKENNVSAYTERFQELTLIRSKFDADETEKIDKSVKASKPKTLDETI